MKSTVTLSHAEVEVAIRYYLNNQGYDVEGAVTFNVAPGFSDPREPSYPHLTSAQATVKTITHRSDNLTSLGHQIAKVESQGQWEGR